jgi:hypothetical protein
MHPLTKAILLVPTLFALLFPTGCAKTAPKPAAPVASAATQPALPEEAVKTPPATENGTAASRVQETQDACLECEAVDPARDRSGCFKLQPGKTTKNAKGKIVTGRCQPQCIPYARCRSGIATCRLGDTGPVEWFECARKSKATTSTPKAGSIMVIDVNTRRKMPTGHLGYVEEACPNPDGTWTLRFSHTNYDRKCHLDLDARVLFNPKTMSATFQTGAWKAWAKDLKIRGFILK